MPRPNLAAPAVIRVGLRCATPERYAATEAAGRRLECRAFREAKRAGSPVPARALARCRSWP